MSVAERQVKMDEMKTTGMHLLLENASSLAEETRHMSYWQIIFLQSKVNGAVYDGDSHPAHNWKWPDGTWFQKHLRSLRETRLRLAESTADQAFE